MKIVVMAPTLFEFVRIVCDDGAKAKAGTRAARLRSCMQRK